MNSVNLLFLNVGRRIELVRAFRETFHRLGIAGKIVGTDINGWAPGLYEADKAILLPISSDEKFFPALKEVCHRQKIELVIPLIDPDLLVLAQRREQLEAEKTRVLISSARTVQICRDKRELYIFLQRNGFPVPHVLSYSEASNHPLPLFLKAANGSASVNAHKVNTREALKMFSQNVPDPIIQEFVEGDEITVDVFSNWSGKARLACPRRRVKVRAGEVLVGSVERDRLVEELAIRVAESLGTVGPVNVQILRGAQGLFVSEVNPRFGGGVPLSIAAGAPFPEWTIRLALGQEVPETPVELYNGLSMLRFDQSRFLPMEKVLKTP